MPEFCKDCENIRVTTTVTRTCKLNCVQRSPYDTCLWDTKRDPSRFKQRKLKFVVAHVEGGVNLSYGDDEFSLFQEDLITLMNEMGWVDAGSHKPPAAPGYTYRNKGTNEVFQDLEDMVLDAQKRYKRCMGLTYCDIEGLLENAGDYYILDECGNWEYFPTDLYEIIPVQNTAPKDTKNQNKGQFIGDYK